MLTQFNLDLLRVFSVVAADLSIKDAAKKLGVTPSAVSQGIAKLENQLEVQLFLREHKKISLAQAGVDLMNRTSHLIHGVLAEMNEFSDQCASKVPSGLISIGAPVEFGSLYLIKWFSEFQKKYPKTRIKLCLGSPPTLLRSLAEGDTDFLIADNGPYFEGIKSSHAVQPLFQEELVLCCATAMGKVDPTFRGVSGLPHLDYSQDGSAVGIWYMHHFGKKPKELQIVMVSENVRSLIHGVKSSLGVAMVPRYLIRKELENGSLKVISPTKNEFMNELVLVQHRDKIPSLSERLFLAMLRSKPKIIGTKPLHANPVSKPEAPDG